MKSTLNLCFGLFGCCAVLQTITVVSANNVVVNLSESWQESDLYNKNAGYCAIQQETPSSLLGYLVIKDGKIVAEGYGDGTLASDINFIYSGTKSWSTLLIGICVDKGLVALNATLGEIFDQDDDWAEVNDAESKKSVTLEEILTMSSGLVDVIRFGNNQETLAEVLDTVRFAPLERGSFNYLPSTHILARIIERVTGGLTPLEFAIESGTFDALGVTGYEWLTFGGVEGSAFGLKINPRTLAKLGQLYLQDGFAADGVPIVDASWVESSRTNQLPRGQVSNWPIFRGYGYQWYTDLDRSDNLNPTVFEGAYTAAGYGGQYLTVFPEENAVVVIMVDPALTQITRSLQAVRPRFLLAIARNLRNFEEPVDECRPRGLVTRFFQGLANNVFDLRVIVNNQIEVLAESTSRFFST